MRLHILRENIENDDEGTPGIATLPDHPEHSGWHSLELPWRDNQQGKSCIPVGTYTATLYDSPHFGRKVYLLQDVPGRSAVEIHPANWAGDVDKGWYSDLRGCMALGKGTGIMVPNHEGYREPQRAVTSSKVALDELQAIAGDESLEITIEWATT